MKGGNHANIAHNHCAGPMLLCYWHPFPGIGIDITSCPDMSERQI